MIQRSIRHQRRGNVVALVAVLLPVLAGMGAFAVDVGYICYSRSRLQSGADAAALAAVEELPGDQATLNAVAQRYAALNDLSGGSYTVTVEGGTWDESTAVFTAASLTDARAVRVTLVRSTALSFGALVGTSSANIQAAAIATKAGGIGTRFLIDDEMIDTDVPAIQSLAASTGKTTEQLLKARGFNQGKRYGASNWTWTDNFIDLPAGASLTLPTGQGTSYGSNDAGMFDIDFPQFPYADSPSFIDFVMYSESGNDNTKWGTDKSTIKSQLDPLLGASPVYNSSNYSSYVNPDFIHVTPVFSSDMSTLNMQSGVPRINAKGLRRGLIAFKITAVGSDIDGGGSLLPQLVIKIVDPATFDADDIRHFSQILETPRLVK